MPTSAIRLLTALLIFLVLALPAVGNEGTTAVKGRFLGGQPTEYPSWFKESFLELAEDLNEARAQGRRVLVLFTQDSCPYCHALVDRNLSQKDIEEYMRRQHNILVGERTAEQIKIEVGSALTELEDGPPDYAVRGRDLMTGIPKEITVTYAEIAQALDKSISKIEEAILSALEATPPELSADIYRTGIYMAGGGALLRGLDKRISAKTKLPVHVAEDPLRAVARGTGIALKNIDRFQFLMRD